MKSKKPLGIIGNIVFTIVYMWPIPVILLYFMGYKQLSAAFYFFCFVLIVSVGLVIKCKDNK